MPWGIFRRRAYPGGAPPPASTRHGAAQEQGLEGGERRVEARAGVHFRQTEGRMEREAEIVGTNGSVPVAQPVNGDAQPRPASNGSTSFEYELLHALQAIRAGDFSVRLGSEHAGLSGKIADVYNEIAASSQRMAQQLERVGQDVGRDGKTRQRVKLGISSGSWGEMEDSI